MNDVYEFFRRLADTSDWPPRWFCGRWTDFHGWLYIASDLAIWLAYMTIPLVLIRFIFVKEGVPLGRVFWLFGAFILLCGLTHLLDATMFWWPAYRINALVRFVTGVVSIGTVVALFRHFDEAVGLRTSREYERELTFRQQAVQELTRSNQELQQFAYVASHDLQSPLKTIENYLGLLERRHGDVLDDEARRLIGVSTAAAGRMRTLINDLLDLSKVGSSTDFTDVNLNGLVDEILLEQHDEVEAAGASVDVGPLPTLHAHRTDLKQLFQNLISNAIKYHKPGVAPRLTIRASDGGGEYRFTIADNGIGIEPTYHKRIFEVFQRLHGRGEYPGTGIGLATCKKVVEIYGGQIGVESEEGQGSTFYFTLPKVIKTVNQYVQADSLHPVG
jgi:signal transduction histidine kinase